MIPKKIWIVLRANGAGKLDLIPMEGMLSVLQGWEKPGTLLATQKWVSLWTKLGFGSDGDPCRRWAKAIPERTDGDRNYYGKWTGEMTDSLSEIGILKDRSATMAELSKCTVDLMIAYYNKVKHAIRLPTRVGGGVRDGPVLFEQEDDTLGFEKRTNPFLT